MAVNATAIWRVRPSGSNTNGGGYDPGISGAATDYSQQNAAQASGSHGTATGTTTFTDTVAANFTSAMVGNALWIASGAGFTVGAYFVVTFNSATSVVLDRSPGTGTVAVWALGGGWADPATNLTSSGPIVAGNIVYTLGSGTPNPSSYTYDYASGLFGGAPYTIVPHTIVANDPSTPGYLAPPNTTGGMPTIQVPNEQLYTSSNVQLAGLWFVISGTFSVVCISANSNNTALNFGVVADQFGHNGSVTVQSVCLIGCEIFSSVSAGATANQAYQGQNGNPVVSIGNNIHDCLGIGVTMGNGSNLLNSIVAKNGSDGIQPGSISGVMGCTIDGNGGNGISASGVPDCLVLNNIISNQTGAGKFGLIGPGAGTYWTFGDYNVYYNNTSNYSGITAGPHDTALGTTPYVASSTENYSLV